MNLKCSQKYCFSSFIVCLKTGSLLYNDGVAFCKAQMIFVIATANHCRYWSITFKAAFKNQMIALFNALPAYIKLA